MTVEWHRDPGGLGGPDHRDGVLQEERVIDRADRGQLCGLEVDEQERRVLRRDQIFASGSRAGALVMRAAPSRGRDSDEPEASGPQGDRLSPDSSDSCFAMCRRISRGSGSVILTQLGAISNLSAAIEA